jgi:hypothetical protein
VAPYLVALASCALALLLVGPTNLLVVAILLSIGGILLAKPLVDVVERRKA